MTGRRTAPPTSSGRLARGDPRIQLVQHGNRGLAGARNSALRAARGDFFALLDSDDLWEPDFLAEQMAILEARPDVDIVTGNGWYLGGAKHGQLARPFPDPRPAPDLAVDHRRRVVGVHHVGVPPPASTRRSGRSTRTCAATRTTTSGCAPRSRASRFYRNDRPLGHYRVRSDSLSASDVRMLRGILHVYTKLRPVIAERPREMAILDRQISRFEAEWMAAEARLAIEIADFEAAREHLGALHARRGGAALGLARLLARWAPNTLTRMIRFKRAATPALHARPAAAALTAMKYSIVIATYNRAADLRDTLRQPRGAPP